MIDANTETLVSFTEAVKDLPRRRSAKRPHVSTLYRWSTSGCKGVVLESLQCGGTRVTSKEALARFFERLTYSGDRANPAPPPDRRQRAADAAMDELEREGL